MGRRNRLEEQHHPLHIAIIGSGLSGLSTAICLEQQQQPHVVTVYERDPAASSRREGYGLTLTYHPSGILQSPLGILDELASADCPSRSHLLFVGGGGRIGGYFGNDFDAKRGGWGQRGNLRVPRRTVRQVMMNKLQRTPIRWGHRLVEMSIVGENDETTITSRKDTGVRLRFDNGETVVADVVIAADGIRSTVVQLWIPDAPSPKSLGIRIILGITAPQNYNGNDNDNQHSHEVLHERGFYTLDTGMRLFVMPYSGSALGRSLCPKEPVRFMWQLSFAVPQDDNKDGKNPTFTPQQLQEEALNLTRGWHEPVQSLIRSTPLTDIWGTLLYDRDPVAIQQNLLKQPARVIVTGDALHAMSPFKGQGANRCLQDGAIIAKWLSSSTRLAAVVKGSVREMTQRTATTVAASRTAAQFWHSPQALKVAHKFAGIHGDEEVETLLTELEKRGINADSKDLHQRIRSVIDELGLQSGFNEDDQDKKKANAFPDILVNGDPSSLASQAMDAASNGNLAALRKLSWEHPNWLRRIFVDQDKSTCLHAAAATGHVETVHWLVTQAGCDLTAMNQSEQTPQDAAAGHPVVCELLDRLLALDGYPHKERNEEMR